jgi:short-subunit dehydrogenase
MKKPIALITGASTGIGRSLSIKLSKKYFIYLISRNKENLNKTKELINAQNNDCKIIVSDISKTESIHNIYSQIEHKNKIELLINNAGIGIFKNITDTSIKDWDDTLNTNLRGAFLMTKMVIDDLKSKKNGKIVFISSVAGMQPYKNSTAYVASKYGVRGFAAALREELREFNIKVITIFPGAVNTPIWDDKNMEELREGMMKTNDLTETIFHAINAPNNCVTEEIIIRRTSGDF